MAFDTKAGGTLGNVRRCSNFKTYALLKGAAASPLKPVMAIWECQLHVANLYFPKETEKSQLFKMKLYTF